MAWKKTHSDAKKNKLNSSAELSMKAKPQQFVHSTYKG